MNDYGMMMEGPSITGNWQNPKTGDFFTVRDSFMEDDDFIIITTDGRRLNYKMLQDYSQTTDKIEELKHYRDLMKRKREQEEDDKLIGKIGKDDDILTRPLKPATPQRKSVQSPKIMEGIDEDMVDEISGLMGNYGGGARVANDDIRRDCLTTDTPAPVISAKPALKDADIIERALRRVAAPEIELDLAFERFPQKQIEMLVDLMGCEFEDIAAWMYERYFSGDFKSIIIDKITKMLESRLCLDCDVPSQEKIVAPEQGWVPPFPENKSEDAGYKPVGEITAANPVKTTKTKTTKKPAKKKSKK